MKRVSTIILMILTVIATLPTVAQSLLTPNRKAAINKSRKVYCMEMYHPGWGASYGIASFNTDNVSDFELVQDLYATDLGGGQNAVFCGAAANDIYYAYFYTYSPVDGPAPRALATVNLRNGDTRQIINYKLNLEIPKLNGMTYDYSTETMYGVGFEGGRDWIYTVDLKYGTINKLVILEEGSRANSIAATMDGELYGFGNNGDLLKINKTDGTATKVMSTGIPSLVWTNLEFDHTDETLYCLGYQVSGTFGNVVKGSVLIKFDLKNKTHQELGKIDGAKVYGMYIPYLKAGFDAPGAPTELTAVVGERGVEKATISWKNPNKTYGDESLTTISSIKVLRDGEVVKTFTGVTTGQTMSWVDDAVKTGGHIYSICGVNDKGDGEFGKIDCFVGIDTPAKVNELDIHVNTGYDNTTITWQPPTEGSRGGYFEQKNLTYTVVRYPDSLIIAKNITELTFTDRDIRRLSLYDYSVTASNPSGQGKETFSISRIMGKPLNIPYMTYFDNRNEVMNTWSGDDHNNDGNSWIFNLGLGQSIFGSSDTAAEYLADDRGKDADDWLVSPPFNFTSGNKYKLTFNTRNIGEDSLVVALITIGSPRRDMKTIKVQGESPAKGKVAPWKTTILDLPTDIQAGVYCIGIHIVTPWGNSGYLQLTNFNVSDATGIENETMQSDVKVFNNEGMLNIYGEFNTATIYNSTGLNIGNVNSDRPHINTVNWNSGIYFVKITRGETSIVHKVVIK